MNRTSKNRIAKNHTANWGIWIIIASVVGVVALYICVQGPRKIQASVNRVVSKPPANAQEALYGSWRESKLPAELGGPRLKYDVIHTFTEKAWVIEDPFQKDTRKILFRGTTADGCQFMEIERGAEYAYYVKFSNNSKTATISYTRWSKEKILAFILERD